MCPLYRNHMIRSLSILCVCLTLWSTTLGQLGIVDSLKNQLGTTQSRAERVDLLNEISWELYEINVNELGLYADSALVLAQAISYDKGIARGLNLKAVAQADSGNRMEALHANKKALQIAAELNDFELLTAINNDLAILYSDLNDHAEALRYYHASLDAAKILDDPKEIAWTMGNLGNELISLGENEKGNEYLEEAIKISTAVDDPLLIINIQGVRGRMFMNAEDWDEAEEAYKEQLALTEKHGFPAKSAQAYMSLGRLYQAKNEPKAGLIAYLKAKEYFQASGKRFALPYISYFISQAYLDLDDIGNSMKYARTALREGDEVDSNPNYGKICETLSDLYRIQEQWDSAYHYENKLRLFNTKYYKERLAERLGETELTYQLKNEEDKNARLTALAERDEALIAKRSIMLIASILALLLAAAIAIWYYRVNQKSRQTSQFKDQLFSIVSHDLRAPMASLKGLMDAVREGYITAEEFPEMLELLDKEMTQTDQLLNNLLHWSKSQLDGLKPKPQKIKINRIIAGGIALYEPIARKKQVHLKADIDTELIGYADPEMIKLIVRNLLSNALKYSKSGGTIHLDSGVEKGKVFVKIRDEGIGMSEDAKKKLAENEHFSTLGTQEERGTGLGLVLVKDFLQKNKGRFWFDSEKGKGSTFAFSIPQKS